GITSKLNSSLPSYQKITKEKNISFIVLMGKVSGTKQLLDQLADASFAVWDTMLHEVEFSQVFKREISKCGIALSENDIEKTLLFLNRIRIQLGRIEKSQFNNTDPSDRLARKMIDQMITEQSRKTNVISKDILAKIAAQTLKFKELALDKAISHGDEKSEINREIQEIYNLQSYQDNPFKYSQIVALLLFIHSRGKGLLEQIRTGEEKTLIVGIAAAFFALCGQAVDVVSSNRDLVIEGEQKCRSFFELLKLESGHICSENDEVNHQSYRLNLNPCQGNIIYGEVGAFQRDILEEEFNNKKNLW
ncbi:unnamed protein product, partial [Rotaria magnacalcarata]